MKELGRLNAALLSAIAECSARVAISLLMDSKLRLVKAEPSSAGNTPVKLAAGIAVKLVALAAGNVAGNLASATVPVKLAAGKLLFSSSKVPVVSGSVSVLFVLVLGAVTVSVPVPLACPCIFTVDIYLSYAIIIQELPVGTVTEIPLLIVIGPAVRALLPLVIL